MELPVARIGAGRFGAQGRLVMLDGLGGPAALVGVPRLGLLGRDVAVDLEVPEGALYGVIGAMMALESRRRTGHGQVVDVAIETTGVTELIETAYEVTAPQGRVILVGVPPKAAPPASAAQLPRSVQLVRKAAAEGVYIPDAS